VNWHSPGRLDRQVAWLWAVCAILAVAFRPVWLAAAGFLPPCPWHALTGWACPGCGTTRAVVSLLHGRVGDALAFNPLSALAAIAFFGGGILAPIWLACGGPAVRLSGRPRPLVAFTAGAGFLANWVWLVASGV
jgi:hypothetical protein